MNTITIPLSLPDQEIFGNNNLEINEDKFVYTFIGANGTGKSKLLDAIKQHYDSQDNKEKLKIIGENVNAITSTNTINKEQLTEDLLNTKNVDQTASLINSDDVIKSLVVYYFKKLFKKELTIERNEFKIQDIYPKDKFAIRADGDGFKAFFNLVYYLISPDYKRLAIDEPEQFFHPNLQLAFFDMIKFLAERYKKKIFLVTHSPNFIDFSSKTVEVFLLRKTVDGISIFNITEIMNETYNNQFKIWLHYNRHILFSDSIVLLEGYTDQLFLNALIEKFGHESLGRNITFVSVAIEKAQGGKAKIGIYKEILDQFFDVWAIYDRDAFLNQDRELSCYLDPEEVAEFGTKRSKSLSERTKDALDSFFENSTNDKTLFEKLGYKLKKKKAIILWEGEVEDYYQTSPEPDKNKKFNNVLNEMLYIETVDPSEVKTKYKSLFEIFDTISNISNEKEIRTMTPLLVRIISNFLREVNLLDNYSFVRIPGAIKNHLMQDPEQGRNWNFEFCFLPGKQISIEKDIKINEIKNRIENALKN